MKELATQINSNMEYCQKQMDLAQKYKGVNQREYWYGKYKGLELALQLLDSIQDDSPVREK